MTRINYNYLEILTFTSVLPSRVSLIPYLVTASKNYTIYLLEFHLNLRVNSTNNSTACTCRIGIYCYKLTSYKWITVVAYCLKRRASSQNKGLWIRNRPRTVVFFQIYVRNWSIYFKFMGDRKHFWGNVYIKQSNDVCDVSNPQEAQTFCSSSIPWLWKEACIQQWDVYGLDDRYKWQVQVGPYSIIHISWYW